MSDTGIECTECNAEQDEACRDYCTARPTTNEGETQ